jgi:hypothetical protein
VLIAFYRGRESAGEGVVGVVTGGGGKSEPLLE